jgi:hypothetical protein
VTFEFLIAYYEVADADIEQVLTDLLTKTLSDNQSEFGNEEVENMMLTRHQRSGQQPADENGEPLRYVLRGFALELPDEMEQIETVVEDFAAALSETRPIFHAIKFEDPILRQQLAERAEEIFVLEMKLRRVLSFIYLHAKQALEPYNLLSDETEQPPDKDSLTIPHMKAVLENQFFHLTFGQYVGLNNRPEFKLPAVLVLLRNQASFEAVREELIRSPVAHENDVELLAGLKERVNSIESMRNCVAHNRRPSKRVSENYKNALPLLHKLLEEYLTRWEQTSENANTDGGR